MQLMNISKAEYLTSAVSSDKFIHDGKPQVVFAGRSNVGKSSVLNTLTGIKNLARVGNTPGKTRMVNYFLVDKAAYFVDLPGYGYAKVSHTTQDNWANLIEEFFTQYDNISLGVVIVDIRHDPSELDKKMASYFQQTCLPWIVIANKSDKLKPKEIPEKLAIIRKELVLDDSVACIAFSGLNKTGKNQAVAEIMRRISN